MAAGGDFMLSIQNLSVKYGKSAVPAVQGIHLEMKQGEIVSIVGESGSGKTTVLRAIMGCLPGSGYVAGGDIRFGDQSLADLSPEEWRNLRGTELSMIFQDSGSMLNPVRRIGSQYVEYICMHQRQEKKKAWKQATEMLEKMHLTDADRVMRSYPFQLSGGMRQRVGIAMAMTFQPRLLLADEPTSSLDVTTQSQIVAQMLELREKYGTGILLVTHNLGTAVCMADRIIVMHDGHFADAGTREEILNGPVSDYTRKLLESVPAMGGERFV